MILDQFDLPIMKFLSSFVGRSDLFDHLVNAIEYYDIFKGVPVMSMLWLAWFYRPEHEPPARQEERRVHLLIIFAGSIAIVALSRVLQIFLNIHKRPILAGLNLKYPAFIDPASVNTWNSFPSDHSMLFFALATGLWQANRMIGSFAFFWVIVMLDLPRIYLGYHYPSDVVVGALLGISCLLAFEQLPLRTLAGRVLTWSKLHPATFFGCAFFASDQVAHLFNDIRGLGSIILNYLTSGS
jgi:undecaprenyl-diphosphatase